MSISLCAAFWLALCICVAMELKLKSSNGDTQACCNSSRADSYKWNKTAITSNEYQQSFCPRRCRGSQLVLTDAPFKCSEIDCFPCDCKKPMCRVYGTCCPAVTDSERSTSFSTPMTLNGASGLIESDLNNSKSERAPPNDSLNMQLNHFPETITQCGVADNDFSFLYIRSCPVGLPPGFTRTRCENDTEASQMDIQTFVHVTDNATGVVYFNEYCARCNNILEFTKWRFTITCAHFQKVYQALSEDEFFRLSLQTTACKVSHSAPVDQKEYGPKCTTGGWFGKIVDTCKLKYGSQFADLAMNDKSNRSRGYDYDVDVVNACAKRSQVKDRVCESSTCYKNIFCAVCNNGEYPKPQYCPLGGGTTIPIRPGVNPEDKPIILYAPFSLLIHFGNNKVNLKKERKIYHNCSSNSEWPSPDGSCLPLNCSSGKILANGNCSTAVQVIVGLWYRIRLLYTLACTDRSTSTNSLCTQIDKGYSSPEKLISSFKQKMITIALEHWTDYNLRLVIVYHQSPVYSAETTNETNPTFTAKELKWLAIEGIVVATKNESRDEHEKLVAEELILTEVQIKNGSQKTLALTPIVLPDSQKHILDSDFLQARGLSLVDTQMRRISESLKQNMKNMKDFYITMLPDLCCPFVTFSQTDYTLEFNDNDIPPTTVISLNLAATTFVFEEPSELNLLSVDKSGNLKVCQEVLNTKLAQYKTAQVNKYNTLFEVKHILTLVCLGVSLLCLLLTMITYILFLELRNEAGVNNTFLCFSLFLGQASLLVASQIRYTGYLCTVFGISIHFFWLNTFCWSFTCSFHMYRIFTAKTRVIVSASGFKRMLIIKVVVCLVVPAVVVLVVVVAHLVTSGGGRVGYGDTSCSMDSPLLISITLVAPIVAILLCNIAFFLTTVIHIHNIRKLQSADIMAKRDISQNIYIYCKLSTMTGAFWAVVIVSEATDLDPVRIMAIILNGLQGVFIFVSFTCNKRVLDLYRSKKFHQSYLPSFSRSSSMSAT